MADVHSFGPFVLDLERGAILRDGRPVPLGYRAFSVLVVLAERGGQPVLKADLMARVWPDTFVEEGNLTVQIALLRKALGQAKDGESWIQTVPRMGYRLRLGPPRPAQAVDPPDLPRLAVLPFRNLGTDASQTYFADGLVEDLITALSRFRSFTVVSRAVSPSHGELDARQAALEYRARYVLEGTVRRAGDRLRLTAKLVEGESSAPLWAQQFDGALDDVFEFQDRITESVATMIAPRIQVAEIQRSRRERPGSFAVYDLYLQALAKIGSETERDNAEAHDLLSRGLMIEPDNALLLAHAAWVVEHRIAMGWPPFGPDDRRLCSDLARRGLEHAAGDPMIMVHCGMALIEGAREYDLGMAVVQAAVEANPNYPIVVMGAGVAHLICGDLNEAMRLFHRVTHLGPGDPGAHFALSGISHIHLLRGDHETALTWAKRAFAANPNFHPTLWLLIAANAHLGRFDAARTFLERLQEGASGVTIAKIRRGQIDKNPGRLEPVLQGLRLAGLPEG